jgi:YD repeat-containing protein
VKEDPSGLNYTTTYTYNALNGLTNVSQGSQTRTYGYDMLSRVTQAITPESGTTTYSYAASGGTLCSGDPSAVCSRTDARGTATTYSYDTLNRLLTKSYSDGTPTAYFTYDEQSWGGLLNLNNTAGRLSHAWTSAGSGYVNSIYSYDPVGRVADYWQCTPYNCGGSGGAGAAPWDLHYNYDLAGDVTSWTHPAGFTITNTVSAAQRITEITSSLSDSTHPPILAQNMTYTAWGALSGLQNGCVGTGCIQTQETYTYNNRLQPWMIQLGTSTDSFAN